MKNKSKRKENREKESGWMETSSGRAPGEPQPDTGLAARHGRCQTQMVTLAHLFVSLFSSVWFVFFCV